MDMVIGLLEPDAGQVLVDDKPMADIDTASWRRMIGYVPQETLLLHDSIKNNVSLGDPEVSEAAIQKALEDADLWPFVRALPDGIHTMVGERGGKLSGGQRQRIMIARALVNSPPLLILDEATSALHGQSEIALRETLKNLRGKLTIIAISHGDWLSTTADRVYRLDAGKVECTIKQTA
jgi:ATP-binding cassette subfamily C protein